LRQLNKLSKWDVWADPTQGASDACKTPQYAPSAQTVTTQSWAPVLSETNHKFADPIPSNTASPAKAKYVANASLVFSPIKHFLTKIQGFSLD
jgi:hypothetical protein